MTTRTVPTSEPTVTLDVTLLGRNYKVACREDERAELAEAVAFLERRLREFPAGGKGGGTERIAMMAALNLAHELLRERAGATSREAPGAVGAPIDAVAARRRIASMQAAIDQALAGR